MKSPILIQMALQEKFPINQLSWRIQSSGIGNDNKPYAFVVPYIDSRDSQNRLDEIFGCGGWQDEYERHRGFPIPYTEPIPKTQGKKPKLLTHKIVDSGYCCTIKCKINGEWISKGDNAPDTDIESLKGGSSDAFKRAAVKWGIGRYLYDIKDRMYAQIVDKNTAGAKYHNDYKNNQKYYWIGPQLEDEFNFSYHSTKKFFTLVELAENVSDVRWCFSRLSEKDQANPECISLFNDHLLRVEV